MNLTVGKAIHDLSTLLREIPPELLRISESTAGQPRTDGGWSCKQVLGHLIDSATVNHQRFVRAQLESGFSLLYDGDQWVDLQHYSDRSWSELVQLWAVLNRHLLHAIETVSDDKLENACGHGGDEPWTLAHRIPDYVHHLRHHIEQIRSLPGAAPRV